VIIFYEIQDFNIFLKANKVIFLQNENNPLFSDKKKEAKQLEKVFRLHYHFCIWRL